LKRRIERLEQLMKQRNEQTTPLFFNSQDEYEKALNKGMIREHHICYIDDLEDVD